MIVGKEYHFDSAHFLPDHPKCGNIHGHTYKLIVEVSGPVNNQGFVIDFNILDTIIKKILKELDHTLLNDLMIIPTCENLAGWIRRNILFSLGASDIRNVFVTLQEGSSGYAIATS
jgi:6-pyruvoyltetrahydropterin/6-carboxytetrahydropterin synthase